MLMTIVLGIVGSFVGGFLGYLLFHKDAQDGFLQPSGIIGSIVGAVIVLLSTPMPGSATPCAADHLPRRAPGPAVSITFYSPVAGFGHPNRLAGCKT